jgi:hypothetical protein
LGEWSRNPVQRFRNSFKTTQRYRRTIKTKRRITMKKQKEPKTPPTPFELKLVQPKDIKNRLKEMRAEDKRKRDLYKQDMELYREVLNVLKPYLEDLETTEKGLNITLGRLYPGVSITIPDEKDHDKAWNITSRSYDILKPLLTPEDDPKVLEVKKTFYPWGSHPQWYWVLTFKNIQMNIYWAEPDLDCLPRQISNTSSTWICEK